MVNQYEIWLVNLDPTLGHEMKKTRPCLVISPDEMNAHIHTVMVAPMTTKSRDYPSRVSLSFKSRRAWIVLDQIRSLDRRRFIKKLGTLNTKKISVVKSLIKEMLVD